MGVLAPEGLRGAREASSGGPELAEVLDVRGRGPPGGAELLHCEELGSLPTVGWK